MPPTRLAIVALALLLCAVSVVVTIGAPVATTTTTETPNNTKPRTLGFMRSYQAHLPNVTKEQGITENKVQEQESVASAGASAKNSDMSGVMAESEDMEIFFQMKRELKHQENERMVRRSILSSFLERNKRLQHDSGQETIQEKNVARRRYVGGRVHLGSFRMKHEFARVSASTWRTNSGRGLHAAPFSIRSVACGRRLFVGWTAHRSASRRFPTLGMVSELLEVRAGVFRHVSTKPVGSTWCRQVGSITATTRCEFVALLCRSSTRPARIKGAVNFIYNAFRRVPPKAKRGLFNHIKGRTDHMYLVEWRSSVKQGGLKGAKTVLLNAAISGAAYGHWDVSVNGFVGRRNKPVKYFWPGTS